MNISLICEFTITGRASCSLSNFEFNLKFFANSKASAYLGGLGSARSRAAAGNVKCQKWDYGWLVLKPNGSVFAFKFPHANSPGIYRYAVPFDFSSDIVDLSASGKYVVGIKNDGSLVEWYAPTLPSGVLPSALSLPSGTLSSAVKADDTKLTSSEFERLPPIAPGDLNGAEPWVAVFLSAERNLVIDPVGSYPYISGETVIITAHQAGSSDVTVFRPNKKAHAAGVRWVVNGAPLVAPAQPTGPSANQLGHVERVLNRVNGSFLPAGNDFIQVCVSQAQGGLGDGPVFGLAVRQDGTIAQWGWFDGTFTGIDSSGTHVIQGTNISGLTGVSKVEVSAYAASEDATYYSCNAAALLEDGMVVTWSPSYGLGWYDPNVTGLRRIGWYPRAARWNVAGWLGGNVETSTPSFYTPDPTRPFKVGGVVRQDGKYYIRFRTSATEVHESYALTLTQLSDINTWADLLPEYNATQEMVNRVAGVAGSMEYSSGFYVSPANARVEDLVSFSGGRESWGQGYSYKESSLRMIGDGGSVIHTVGGLGSVVSSSPMGAEKNWLWAVRGYSGGTEGESPVERIMERPELLHGIEKVFASRILGNVDHIYLKKDNALLSFELDSFSSYPFAQRAKFPSFGNEAMVQRSIPNELRITIWPDDSKSNEFTKAYDGDRFINLDYGRLNPDARGYISSESVHNYGKVSGLDIVSVTLIDLRRSSEWTPAPPIVQIFDLTYSSHDKSYLLYPSTGRLTVNYGIPEITRHNGNGCVQSGDYWFSPGFAGDCRPSNRQFKVDAGQMLDVPIFLNQTSDRPVSTVSANNLPSWASLTVYPPGEVKMMLNFSEIIDGERVVYYQVRPLVRLSGIPDNVGAAQVIPFTLTASNSSGSSEASEFTIFVSNVVEIDAEIITSGFFSGAFGSLKNFYVNFRCAAAIGCTIYAEYSAFPNEGEDGEVYEALDSGKAYLWDGVGYVETLAKDFMRGADVIDLNIVSSGGLHVGGSWDFYGDVVPNFSGAGNFAGLLRLLSLKRFLYGEINAPAHAEKMLVFFYTTLNGRITPQPLLDLGISFFENETLREAYREEFIAPRSFNYSFDGSNSIIESEISVLSLFGIYNIWAVKELPPGDVRAHISISLI